MKLPNLAKLPRNQKLAVGGAAVGGVTLLALRRRGGGGPAAAPAAIEAGARQTFAGSAGGSGAYDSTASDVYNALQPQIEALLREVESSREQPSSPIEALNPGSGSMAPSLQVILDAVNRVAPPAAAPLPTPAPAAAPVAANPPSLQSVYGRLPASVLSLMPAADVAASVQAPTGGKFLYGTWSGDRLTKGTYKLPDGTTTTVRS